MYTVDANKQYAVVKHSKCHNDIVACYGTSFRVSTNPLKYKDVSANKMAQRIANGLNLLDKIEESNLNTLTKAQLLELITIK